jgi:hypothetical protein
MYKAINFGINVMQSDFSAISALRKRQRLILVGKAAGDGKKR